MRCIVARHQPVNDDHYRWVSGTIVPNKSRRIQLFTWIGHPFSRLHLYRVQGGLTAYKRVRMVDATFRLHHSRRFGRFCCEMDGQLPWETRIGRVRLLPYSPGGSPGSRILSVGDPIIIQSVLDPQKIDPYLHAFPKIRGLK